MHAHIYERVWLIFGGILLILFLALISISAFGMGMQPPGASERVDPQGLAQDPRFASPGLKQVSPSRYEVSIVAQTFAFLPNAVEVPRGSEVKFRVTSRDVMHGFQIVGTNVNQMVIPGYITEITARFDTAGEYLLICNEYCGAAHQVMHGKIIVR